MTSIDEAPDLLGLSLWWGRQKTNINKKTNIQYKVREYPVLFGQREKKAAYPYRMGWV